MAAVLLRILERPELNKIPKATQNKLEKFLTDVQNENDSLKIQHERFKADCGKYANCWTVVVAC